MCSDRDLYLYNYGRKHHTLRGTLDDDVIDLVLEQATDDVRDTEDCGRSDNLCLEELFATMTDEQLDDSDSSDRIGRRDDSRGSVITTISRCSGSV